MAATTAACAMLGLTLAPVGARAADVYIEPAISVGVGYDDNRRLDPDEPDEETGLELIGEAEIGSKTRTREAVFNAAAHVNRYSDSTLNDTDWYLDLDLLRRWRRDQLGLVTSYRRASTITTELEDTGQLESDQIREDWSISPSWTHQFSRRTQSTLYYEFTDVAYEQGSDTGLFDYQDHFVEFSLDHRLNRTTSVYGRADYSRFESESTTDSDNVTLLVGLERDFSRVFSMGAGLGSRYTDTTFRARDGSRAENSSSGLIYEAHATWELQRSTFNIDGSRSEQSSGRGTPSLVDTVGAAWTRALSRSWDLNLNGAVSRRQYEQVGPQVEDDRVYYDAEARVVWHGRPRWQVDLAYQYQRQDFDEPRDGGDTVTDGSADSNSVWLTMRYSWARMDLSR